MGKKKSPTKKKTSKIDLPKSIKEDSQDKIAPYPAKALDKNLQKLLTKEEREKMEENLSKIEKYLSDIGIVDMKVDVEKLIITIPFEYEEFTFLSHVVISTEWILIKTSIYEIEPGKLNQQALLNLFSEILKGNFLLNSVVYSLDPENKSVWAQADVPCSADFESFKLSYFSIIFAIDYFMKNISPKLQMRLKSTIEKDELKNSTSHLYI
ncbi:hypothetical protein DSAG12_03500 [Promethearchaeum syntrophicum]|uniref:Bacterial sensory transduction regulator n=1 Tax=Promethearchaeum syntrophicum TaxID=2594042 RepID=A0A5B9DFV4_9ARCH|nr:hypothetical protein [Candidatus Prometheoarchaeum syntrophicum]QEE17663.1 hypothetical protein DSAG12_03500 [Candidatus Prometheoarchaeum syntrophicum]